jgi:LysM repeat protein
LRTSIKIQLILFLLLTGHLVQAQTLKGSRTSIDNQYYAAVSYGYTFVKSAHAVQSGIKANQLTRVTPNRYLELYDVSYPYAVPATYLFLSRLSEQHYRACGEKLAVTSLLRPKDRQPANSVARSVHPTGMAVDLRVPKNRKCLAWLQNTLVSLEREKVLDVTRERYPPHFHVAVFSRKYETKVAVLTDSKPGQSSSSAGEDASQGRSYAGSYTRYVVRKGDTLSEIAKRNRIEVAQLRAVNTLRGNLINVGQKLRIPSNTAVAGSRNEVVASYETTHRVNRGDTLWRIANRYGTSVKQLRRANGAASDVLQVGQVLKISKG